MILRETTVTQRKSPSKRAKESSKKTTQKMKGNLKQEVNKGSQHRKKSVSEPQYSKCRRLQAQSGKNFFYQVDHNVQTFSELILDDAFNSNLDRMKISKPYTVQKHLIPLLKCNFRRNIIVHSCSGSGKTLAYLLAIAHGINHQLKLPQAIIIVPTYELAHEVSQMYIDLVKDIKPSDNFLAVQPLNVKEKIINKIIIGTIGSISKLLKMPKIISFASVKFCVVEESDCVIDTKAKDDNILFGILKRLPIDCHQIFLSSMITVDVFCLLKKAVSNLLLIKLSRDDKVLSRVKHFCTSINSDIKSRKTFIQQMIPLKFKMTWLIFCTSKDAVYRLAEILRETGHAYVTLCADMTNEERINALIKIRSGSSKIIVTTGSTTRGISLTNVTHIMHYGLVEGQSKMFDSLLYLNRSTQRMSSEIDRVSLIVTINDEDRKLVSHFSKLTNIKFKNITSS